MGIPVGKLHLYVGGGGFHPEKTLPVVLDCGTDTQRLMEDPFYLGLKQPRLRGTAHCELVDEFMEAVRDKWPSCIIQFEDFQTEYALKYLVSRSLSDKKMFLLCPHVLCHRCKPCLDSVRWSC